MRDQGFHEFYSTLHGRCHQSELSSTYGEGERVDWRQYQLIQALLQAALLEQEKLPRQLLRDIDKGWYLTVFFIKDNIYSRLMTIWINMAVN